MFGKIAGFEFRYQITNPVFWVASIIFALLNFGLLASDNVSMGLPSTVYENGPFGISLAACAFSMFFMFVTTAFVANVVIRDVETGFGPIVTATRINKFDYLIGRFTGATAAACLAFLSIPLGIFIGSLMPWVDPETVGPNLWQNYAFAYIVFGVPNVILTSAVFFAVATLTRSMMGSYVAVVVFLVGYSVATGVLGQKPEFEQSLALLEPLGSGAFGLATKYFTTVERNTLLPPLEGVVLWNRLICLGLAAFALVVAYLTFRFSEKPSKNTKKQKLAALAAATPAGASLAPSALPAPDYSPRTARAQLLRRIKFELGQVFLSPAYAVLVLIGILLSVAQLFFTGEVYGTQTLLLTRIVIDAISGNMGLISIIIATYYSGELVWRERDRKVHEIVDSSSAPDWVFIIPKTITIALVLLTTLLFGVLAAMVVQASRGYTDFEFDKYLLWYVLPFSLDMMLIAVLAVFIQSIVPHKFWGWGFMVIWIIARIVMTSLGFEHNLYDYGGAPGVPTSDMNGLGDFWIGRAWFHLYWSAFATILLVLSYALLRRGAETRLMPRLQRLPGRLKGPAGVIALTALLVFIGSGSFIYLNTNVWNEYRTNKDQEAWLANYEKTLLRYETTPQPQITAVTLNADLYPRTPSLRTRGSYEITNATAAPIAQVHLRGDPDMKFVSLTVPGARLTKDYEEFNYRIYTFATPMQPGETRTITFETLVEQRGFKNSGNTTRLVDNGTFISNNEISPMIGMDRSALLQDPATRRKHGLDRQLRIPKLGTPGADQFNYLRNDSGFVRADITVTTDADQTPIAPGYLRSDVTRNGRRTAHFVSESPIMNFFSIQSARYAVRKRTHNGVEIAVYYYPGHAWNVDRMLKSAELSLDYFQANFSPYQFRQVRFIEFPAYASFAQSFANTIPWSENLGFTADIRDPEKIDYVTYVGAHEIAHQWWAHQIIGANEQGMTLLSETLAQYSALMVMEKLYGPDHIRKFLKFELDRYLRSRGSDLIGEQPLARNENQQYIHYNKGSLVMYLLKDMMGEDKVNAALRRVLARFAFRNAPYPTSADLVNAFRAEAGDDPEMQALITDLFEKITLYDLKAKSATVRRRADGRFDVTVSIEAGKIYADAKGKETKAPLDESFDIGLFTAEPGKPGFGREDVVLFRRMPLKTGVDTLTFTVDRAPTWVGVDPYNKRIDRDSDDNLVRVGS